MQTLNSYTLKNILKNKKYMSMGDVIYEQFKCRLLLDNF